MVQDLGSFEVPADFRGRPRWFVQLWWMVQATLFRMSPQILFGWRRFLLRRFGCKVGRDVLIRPTAEITYPWKVTLGDSCWIGDHVTLYSLGEIDIASNVVISQKSYICTGTHDIASPGFDLCARPVVIEQEAWIAADVFVGPGIRVGRGAVVSARSTVLDDVPAMMVVAGTPARVMRPRPRSGGETQEAGAPLACSVA